MHRNTIGSVRAVNREQEAAWKGPCRLTPRQLECLELRAKHMSAKEIGRQLGISPHTVAMHWRLAQARLRSGQQSASGPPRDQENNSDPVRRIVPLVEFAVAFVLFFGGLLTVLGLGALVTIMLFLQI